MTMTGYSFGWRACVTATLAFALCGGPANAAVVCQKGNKVKLRATACKPAETQVATVGGDDPTGIWEFASGTLFDDSGQDTRFLVFNGDGSGRLNLSGGDGGVITCGTFTYARAANQTLTLDLESIGYLGTRVLQFELAGTTGLSLTNAAGRSGAFEQASAIDPSADCEALTQTGLLTGLPEPEFFTGLAFDGTSLFYEEEGSSLVYPIDPATGTPGTPLTIENTQFTHVHASQGSDFWTHCGCGGSPEAGRIGPAGGALVDEVKTDTELNDEVGVRSIAFDPAAGVLWIHGRNDSNEGRLLKVDPSGEPDVLLAAFDLDADLSGLAFDGTVLWGLNRDGQSVVRIDPTTGQATGNFTIPNKSARWTGIAVVGSELVLLGATGTEGALLKVAIPVP
jgi:hypothetical protein